MDEESCFVVSEDPLRPSDANCRLDSRTEIVLYFSHVVLMSQSISQSVSPFVCSVYVGGEELCTGTQQQVETTAGSTEAQHRSPTKPVLQTTTR